MYLIPPHCIAFHRAGGKYGAKEVPKEENLLQSAQNEELRRAAEVVATSVVSAVLISDSLCDSVSPLIVYMCVVSLQGNHSSGGLSLSSSLWTELLD